MPFDFASAKASVRRVVNTTFGVQAFYQDDSMSTPVETRPRWHSKISRPFGDLENGGYAEVIEGIDRIALIPEDVDGNPIYLKHTGRMIFPTLLEGVEFVLDTREPADGPLEEAWSVTRK